VKIYEKTTNPTCGRWGWGSPIWPMCL